MKKPIVVTYDGSELSRHAFPWGLELARRSSAPLHVVRAHVFSVPAMEPQITPPYEPDFLSALVAYEHADLEQIAAQLRAEGVEVSTRLLETGLVVPLLRNYIQQQDPAWVVMTTHGRGGFSRFWLGSTATGLIKELTTPIILLPESAAPTANPPAQHIAVALDGSEHAESILGPACDLARAFGAKITLVQIVSSLSIAPSLHDITPPSVLEEADGSAEAQIEISLNRVARRLQKENLDVATQVRAVTEPAASALLTIAREIGADMLALSTHGRGFWSRAVLGSVADKVLRTADLPLLIYHPPATD